MKVLLSALCAGLAAAAASAEEAWLQCTGISDHAFYTFNSLDREEKADWDGIYVFDLTQSRLYRYSAGEKKKSLIESTQVTAERISWGHHEPLEGRVEPQPHQPRAQRLPGGPQLPPVAEIYLQRAVRRDRSETDPINP